MKPGRMQRASPKASTCGKGAGDHLPARRAQYSPKTELLRAQRAVVELRGQKAANREAIARVEAALREANNGLQEGP